MTDPYDVIRAAIPGASVALCEYVLWSRTAYPMAGRPVARELYAAAARYRRACEHGIDLCDLCDRIAEDGVTCAGCMGILAASSADSK